MIASRTLPPNLKDYIFVLSIWPYRKKVVNESTSISRHCVNYITASQCIKKKKRHIPKFQGLGSLFPQRQYG